MRFLAATSIAVLVWALAAAGWLDSTVVPKFDEGLRDFYLSVSADSRDDAAPGLLHLTFDNDALSKLGLPTRVPLSAIRDMLDVVRGTNQTIVLDVDLATRNDIEAIDEFVEFLAAWSADPASPLLVLAYPLYDVPYHGIAAYRQLDTSIRKSRNVRWAGVGTFADADGTLRSYEYWSCVDRSGEGRYSALPSVAVYAWARYAAADIEGAIAAVDAAMRVADASCQGDRQSLPVQIFGAVLPKAGIIEYQTSVDALAADGGGRYAPDGLPRLISVGYCQVSPEGCGIAAGATNLGVVAAERIVLVSAANDFSRDEHATPLGYLSGSVILGNAARALINSGPPRALPAIAQLAVVLMAVVLIHVVWAAFKELRARLRSGSGHPVLRKTLHGILNPALVQWLAFAVADLLILVYYYFWFRTSDWNGLIGATFGATTVAAIVAFNEWWSTPWEDERREEKE